MIEQKPTKAQTEAYDLIDRFLRNNLDDADYETFSVALETIFTSPPDPLVLQVQPNLGEEMSEAKHTPGPWHWDSDKYDETRTRFQVVALGRTIAKTYYPDGDGQAKSDTVLMAAAPELLFAAERAEKLLSKVTPADSYIGSPLEQLRAAIAKATGAAS